MNRLLPLALLLPGMVVWAQGARKPVTYRDPQVALSAPLGAVVQDLKNGSAAFELRGGATLVAEKQGLRIAAPTVEGVLVKDPARKGARTLKRLVATGAFRLDRTRAESDGSRTTTIRSTGARYAAAGTDAATITLDADARITDDKGPRSVTLTGDRGDADLRLSGKSADLRRATLVGNVTVKAVQQGPNGLVPYVATGDRLEATAEADGGSTVVMTGDLRFENAGPDAATIEGATKAVIRLDAAGEVVSARLSNDGGGVVRSRYVPPKKGQRKGGG